MSVIEPVVKEGNPPEPEPDPYQFSNNFTTADDGTITLREGNFLLGYDDNASYETQNKYCRGFINAVNGRNPTDSASKNASPANS